MPRRRFARAFVATLWDGDDSLITRMESGSYAGGWGGGGVDVMSGGDESDDFCSGIMDGTQCELAPYESVVDRNQLRLPFEYLDGGKSTDILRGAADSDSIRGGPGRDVLYGGGGDDALTGSDDNDVLNGGDGDDYIDTSISPPNDGVQDRDWVGGSDLIDGGPGNDTYGFAYSDYGVDATDRTTTHRGSGSAETDTYTGIEQLQLSRGSDSFSGPLPGSGLTISSYSGSDQIDVSGNRSPNWRDSVNCGDGAGDSVAIDVNARARPGSIGDVEPRPIQDDGASECEHVERISP